MKNITNFNQENALTLLNSADDFPVDFELAWKWLGFSRKDSAKRTLIACGFEEGSDFLLLHNNVEQIEVEAKTSTKGRRKGEQAEEIWLTNECFKSWGMMASTEKGKEIRKYFLECERQLKGITTAPDREDLILADVLRHDMLAAATMGMSMVFKDLAKKEGLKRTNEAPNYADLAHALFLVATNIQNELSESELDEELDSLRWAVMVRDSFATLHPSAAAEWLKEMAEKHPKSSYVVGFPAISAIPGYR
jgi:phage anti-repressor protein